MAPRINRLMIVSVLWKPVRERLRTNVKEPTRVKLDYDKKMHQQQTCDEKISTCLESKPAYHERLQNGKMSDSRTNQLV